MGKSTLSSRARLMVLALVLGVALSASTGAKADRPAVVFVHGWDYANQGQALWDDVYGDMYDHLVGEGYDVYGPILPRNGSTAGDSVINAVWLKDYISSNNLTNVVLIGHSLGGTVVEYYVRYLDEGEVQSYVLLDSNITTSGVGAGSCWLNPPDQCADSAVRSLIFGAPNRSDLYLLNVWSTYLGNVVPVDCYKYVLASHTKMVSKPQTWGYVDTLLSGGSPC